MQKARFYNAGDRIVESLCFTLPDGHDIHCSARQMIDLSAKDFTDVPIELQIGAATVYAPFHKDIQQRFGTRGVILIDKNRDPQTIDEDEPVAASDKEAKGKGERLWNEYLRAIITQYFELVAKVKAAGGNPPAPGGFTRRAMRLLGVDDPTEDIYGRTAEKVERKDEVAELRRQLSDLQATIAQMAGGQGTLLPKG